MSDIVESSMSTLPKRKKKCLNGGTFIKLDGGLDNFVPVRKNSLGVDGCGLSKFGVVRQSNSALS